MIKITDQAIDQLHSEYHNPHGGVRNDYFSPLFLMREHGLDLDHALGINYPMDRSASGGSGMATPPVPNDGLTVARAELAEALGIVAQLMGRRATGASLRFEDGWLFVAAGTAVAKAPAQGVWPLTIIVGPSWVRRLAKSLPSGDPVLLRVENGRLYANKYSEPCGWSTAKDPLGPSLGKVTEARWISEAATVLKPFLIGREDIEALVEMARKRGPATWLESEETMISAVSKAWAHLAPLGVETSDLRNLVDGAVRNAWETKKDK